MKITVKTCNKAGNVCNTDFTWKIDVKWDKCLNRVRLLKDSTKVIDMEAWVGEATPVIQEFKQM